MSPEQGATDQETRQQDEAVLNIQSGSVFMEELLDSDEYKNQVEDTAKADFVLNNISAIVQELTEKLEDDAKTALDSDPALLSNIQNAIGRLIYVIDNELIEFNEDQKRFARGFANLINSNPSFVTNLKAANALNLFNNFIKSKNSNRSYLNGYAVYDLARIYKDLNSGDRAKLLDFLNNTKIPALQNLEPRLQTESQRISENQIESRKYLVNKFRSIVEQDSVEGELPEISKLAIKFNDALQSGDPKMLEALYFKLRERSTEEQATEKMYEILQYMINKIYETVLIQPPDTMFRQMAQQGLDVDDGNFYQISPEQMYRQLIYNKLTLITEKARLSNNDSSVFFGLKKEIKTVITPNGVVKYSVPSVNYERMNMFEWLKVMSKVASVERDSLELSYDIGFALKSLKNQENAPSIMSQIIRMAASYHPENFNWLNKLPGNTEITKGMMAIVQSWKLGFASRDGIRNDDFLRADAGSHYEAEEDVLKELGELNKQKKLMLWKMRRGFSLGKIGAYFREFMPMLLVSRSISPWDGGDGNPGYKGEGDAIPAVFNPFNDFQQYFSGDIMNFKVLSLPNIRGLDDPKKIASRFEQHYIDSRRVGYLPLLMDELFQDPRYKHEDPYLWVTKWNLFEQGGVDASGGNRLKFQYAPILREPGANGHSILLLNQLSINYDYGTDVLRDGFKSLENVGIDVVRNFCTDYVLNEENFKNANRKENIKSLMTYLFNRYFKNSHANVNGFYTSFRDADAYWDYINRNIFGSEDVTPNSRAKELKKHLYDALTIALIERNPSEIVMMDLPHTSQNGVTLYRELINEFKESRNNWGTRDNEVYDNVKKAFQNLQLVEREVRQEVTEQMLKSSQSRGFKTGALFGDRLDSLRGFDYKVDVSKIERILRELGKDENQIQKTIQLYKSIMRKIWEKPMPKEGDPILAHPLFNGQMDTYLSAHDKFISERMRFFSKQWCDGIIGIQFVENNADIFFDRSAQGSNLVSGTAGAVETLTTTFRKIITTGGDGMDSFYEIVKNYVQNGGDEGMSKIVSSLKAMYSTMKGEDPDAAKKAVLIVAEMVIQSLKASPTPGHEYLASLEDLFSKGKASLAGVKIGDTAQEHTFGEEEIYELIKQLADSTTIKSASDKREKRLVPISDEEVELARAQGREPEMKYVEDLGSENSAEAVLEAYKATLGILLAKGLTLASLIFLITLVTTILKGAYDSYMS